MANTSEIKNRINSIRDTQKITNAMYLISSAKLRKAKSDLDRTRPYFNALQAEIRRIFKTSPDVKSRYFYPHEEFMELNGTYGCLVITADKGLAGAYNHNVLKYANYLYTRHSDVKLFVVGEYGRHYFSQKGVPIEQSFMYPAQRPTMRRAREISSILLDRYDDGEFDKIYIIYTDYKSGLSAEPVITRLLPFQYSQFTAVRHGESDVKFEFSPSIGAVLDNVAHSYVTGFIYSALVDSFCSEQNARMTAMNSAGQNAEKMLQSLSIQYNHARQAAITQEITEVASGARAQAAKRKREAYEA